MKQARWLSEFRSLSEYTRLYPSVHCPQYTFNDTPQTNIPPSHFKFVGVSRVKSGIFGQTAKFGQPTCLFHSSIIGIKIN